MWSAHFCPSLPLPSFHSCSCSCPSFLPSSRGRACRRFLFRVAGMGAVSCREDKKISNLDSNFLLKAAFVTTSPVFPQLRDGLVRQADGPRSSAVPRGIKWRQGAEERRRKGTTSLVGRPMILFSLSPLLSRSLRRSAARAARTRTAALRNRRIKAEIDDGERAEVEAANRRSMITFTSSWVQNCLLLRCGPYSVFASNTDKWAARPLRAG